MFSGSLHHNIPGTGKATNFIFCVHIYRLNRNKSPLKFREKKPRGRSQELPKIFSALIHRAHRAVVFAIAQLSILAQIYEDRSGESKQLT